MRAQAAGPRFPVSAGLAVAAGAAQAASIAWPLAGPGQGQALWWLQLMSLALLAGLVTRAPTALHAAAQGWAFAIAWLAGTWWWLFVSMHVYGGLPAALAVAAVLALAAFLGLYYALAAGVARRFGAGGGPGGALVFAGAWLLAELMRGTLFTGFPWGAVGYAHVDGPLAPLAPWLGVYGIGFVAAFLAACAACALVPASQGEGVGIERFTGRGAPSRRACALALGAATLAIAAVPLAPQADRGASAGRLSVALLQGNIPQDEKFQAGSGIPLALDWYARELRAARADLVVAPETAIPLLPAQLPPGYLAHVAEPFLAGRQVALVGLPLGDFREGYTNSVIGLRPGAPYRYDKHHLVPFGEFIPPMFRWFTDLMRIPLGDFNRGGVGQPSLAWKGQRLAPNICYEDLFGEELGARFADPARAPTVFVNVSNIAWFGHTVAIDQHLHISRMRALEFRRPMLRATNTGATAVIDHRGHVTHTLARHTRGVLAGEVEGREGLTPFARWVSAWRLWPLWGLGVAIVLLAAWRQKERFPR